MTPTAIPPRPADTPDRSWIFTPPPGWPAQPPGWQPPFGWQPDPSWPPAPAGWEFWRAVPHRKRRGVSFYIKVFTGVITFAATLAGLYLAFSSRPHPFTSRDWTRKANAACEKDSGDVAQATSKGIISLTRLLGGQSGMADPQAVVENLVDVAGAESKVLGELRDLTPPVDRRSDVNAVLSTGDALVSNTRIISVDVSTVLLGTPDPSGRGSAAVTTELSDALKANFLTVVPSWRKAIGPLGLNKCPLWVSDPNVTPTLPGPVVFPTTPGTPAPTTSSPAPSLTDGEQQLVGLLDPSILTSCDGRPDQEGDGVVAAVNCSPVRAGPTKRPLVVRFADAASAQAWFTSATRGIIDENDCAAGQKLGPWTHNNVNVGLLGCTATTTGGFRMVWVIDSALVGVIADGSDGTVMSDWWQQSAYVVSSGD